MRAAQAAREPVATSTVHIPPRDARDRWDAESMFEQPNFSSQAPRPLARTADAQGAIGGAGHGSRGARS